MGFVLDGAGKPVQGVAVQAFLANETPGGLIGNVGAGLVGNAGGGLIGNAGGGLAPVSSLRRTASIAGTTDASGSFYIWTSQEGEVNLEAVQSRQSKAWKFRLKVDRTALATVSLTLSPTATLSGKVEPASGATGDIVVYIPGSSYWTFADASGSYQFGELPPGKFELKAARKGFKESALAEPLKLTAGTSTVAPTITLEASQGGQ